MIDVIEFHEALRWSEIVEDIAFHATGTEHEIKLRKALAELGEDPRADERIEELECALREAEESERDAREELKRVERRNEELEEENRELSIKVLRLEERAK